MGNADFSIPLGEPIWIAMKKVVAFLMFLLLFGGVALWARSLGPVEGFSRQGDLVVIGGRIDGKGAKVKVYGDSLSAESGPDRREWMLWRGDSAFYAGEETFRTISAPVVKVPAAVWPLVPETEYNSDFFLYVRKNKEAVRPCAASYSAKVLPRVDLVLPEGDTLKRVAPLESVLRVEADSAEVWERRVVRWFVGNERVPVVLSVTDSRTEAVSGTYCIVPEDLIEIEASEEDRPSDEVLANCIKSAKVSIGAGGIDVAIDFTEYGNASLVSVGLSNASGVSYAIEQSQASGKVEIRLPVAGLPAGDYIVGITLSNPAVVEKRLIHLVP